MRYPIDPFISAVELAAAIRRKEVSPVEVADCYLERMDELDPLVNAFCYRADDNVRKAASAAADAVVRAASTEDLPPPVGAWRAGTDEDPLMALFNSYPMVVFTSLFNVTGQPAISVPIHHDGATGLPVGVQIVAAPWRDDVLLQVSRTLELAHPWANRHPEISRDEPLRSWL